MKWDELLGNALLMLGCGCLFWFYVLVQLGALT